MVVRKIFLVPIVMTCALAITCRPEAVQVEVEFRHIPEEACWIVHHKSVRETYKEGPYAGRTIQFPVFNGTKDEIDIEDLYNRIPKPNVGPRDGQAFCLIVPAGQVKKTVQNIISFYSKHILKGVDILHPEYFGECRLKDTGSCPMRTTLTGGFAYYDLTIDGVPKHYFDIMFPTIPNKSVKVSTIWDIPIAENGGWKSEANAKTRKDAIIKWWLGS